MTDQPVVPDIAEAVLSGAEIHPAARIGRRFVLDHGYGTVIGETCEIGHDCYILCGVTLGARGIANNPDGKRHPRLGNNVEVGSGARVLGYVRDTQNYVHLAAQGLSVFDVGATTRVARDLEQWQSIRQWLVS